uniref:Uncharacterized protein n=1 Tax=Rhizophora mucronata TaxID=61149 RepID=A0A2P2NPW9_RHIMU
MQMQLLLTDLILSFGFSDLSFLEFLIFLVCFFFVFALFLGGVPENSSSLSYWLLSMLVLSDG